MKWYDGLRHPGVLAALSAAILFGAGTPLAKQLLNTVSPWLLAGLLYLGSGIGLTLYRLITRPAAVSLPVMNYCGLLVPSSPGSSHPCC